jgi:excisionase family DNA binding protein
MVMQRSPADAPVGKPAGAGRPEDRWSMPKDNPLAQVRFLTVAEVAAIMRVSKMTVYRLVHAGDLPAVRVGRSFRVPEQAVHDYLRTSFIETA